MIHRGEIGSHIRSKIQKFHKYEVGPNLDVHTFTVLNDCQRCLHLRPTASSPCGGLTLPLPSLEGLQCRLLSACKARASSYPGASTSSERAPCRYSATCAKPLAG